MIAAFAASLLRVPHVTAVIIVFICPCSPSWAGPGQEGNPKLGRLMHLVSQTDLSITICPDGTVKGSPGLDEYGLLEISSVGFNNEVRLRGVKSGLYLGMDEQGILYGEADPTNEATVFASGVHGAYNTYQAKAHVGEDTWFVGLRRRTGMPKPGPLTRPEQKAARFLPVRPASGEGGSGGGGGGGAPL
ncbi:hypothetical protein R5R35_007266 [Gryllus longicercus]|uniref:FGF n=1 Tax=Gryllus longicercus TaxID=2509291 RepID=A0AAN9ZBT9_9ORTH